MLSGVKFNGVKRQKTTSQEHSSTKHKNEAIPSERQSWMIDGDFNSLLPIKKLNQHPNTSNSESTKVNKPSPELNPSLCPLSSPNGSSNPPMLGSVLVGDGGRSWRASAFKRAQKNERESSNNSDGSNSLLGVSQASFSSSRVGSDPYGDANSSRSSTLGHPSRSFDRGEREDRGRKRWMKPSNESGSFDKFKFKPHSDDVSDTNIYNKGNEDMSSRPDNRRASDVSRSDSSTPSSLYDGSSHDYINPPPIDSKANTKASNNDGDMDLNVLSSKALKCLMQGDERGYLELEKKKEAVIKESGLENHKKSNNNINNNNSPPSSPLRVSLYNHHSSNAVPTSSLSPPSLSRRLGAGRGGREVRVLESVSASGEYRPLVESERREKEKRMMMGSGGDVRWSGEKESINLRDGYYTPDRSSSNISVEDMVREIKGRGVEDYDKNYAQHVLKKGSRYRAAHEEDDEIHLVDEWEGRELNRKTNEKGRARERMKMINDSERERGARQKCLFCIDSHRFTSSRSQDIISTSARAFVIYQSLKQCVVSHHFVIAPNVHMAATTQLDEDVYEDMRNHMKSLVACLDSLGEAAIFVESVGRMTSVERGMLGGGPHCTVECFGIPIDRLQESKIYFKKALLESGSYWSSHKKIIEVVGRKGCRGAVPKGFPFFFVDFSLTGGFAQVVEDHDRFPRDLGRQVVQGLMGGDVLQRAFNSKQEHSSAVRLFCSQFKPFDWSSLSEKEGLKAN